MLTLTSVMRHFSNLFLMNEIVNNDNWAALKIELQKKYPHLTDDDLFLEEGKADEMLINIQKKTGRSYDEMVKYIKKESSLSQLQLLFN